jgi:hypothetical protein
VRACVLSELEVDDASLDDNGKIRDLWAWSIAAKRYATFTWVDGRPVLADKYSEHGLGHLADPRPIDQRDRPLTADIWQHILDAELGTEAHEPEWFNRPAVTQRTISTPRLLSLLGGGRSSESRLRPYSFCNHAIIHPDEPGAGGRDRFDLVAAYERDPERWADVGWADAGTGSPYPITTSAYSGAEAIRVKSIRDTVTLYRRKREAKSLGPDGAMCSRETRGLLQRRPVRDLAIRHIGKEANEIEEVIAGIASASATTVAYEHRLRTVYGRLVAPALLAASATRLTEATGLPRGTINGLRRGRQASAATVSKLLQGLAPLAPGDPGQRAFRSGFEHLGWLRDAGPTVRECQVCGRAVGSRQLYCSSACRQRAYRLRRSLTR